MLPSVERVVLYPAAPKAGDTILVCFKILGCADSHISVKSAKYGALTEGSEYDEECHRGMICAWITTPPSASDDDLTIFCDSPGMTSYGGIVHVIHNI